ncbi:peroxisomal membrane anchor protein conserved region-domain-containing protein [Syncephalis fuscata]|nr:peroxisomal membrane anchor protein conserved region-domain-containing protein [Syncephalis fuscata]
MSNNNSNSNDSNDSFQSFSSTDQPDNNASTLNDVSPDASVKPEAAQPSGILAQLKPMTAEERQEKMKALRARQKEAAASSSSLDSAPATTPAVAPTSESTVPATSNSTPPAIASPSIPEKALDAVVPPRANMIEQAVRFLRAPNVQSAPMSKKLEFLRGKGLTETEMNMALEDANKPTTETAPNA